MQGQEQRYDCAAMQRDSRFPELFGMGWNQPQSGFKPMKYCTLWGHLNDHILQMYVYIHIYIYICNCMYMNICIGKYVCDVM